MARSHLLIIALAAGCAEVGPDYVAPAIDQPAAFAGAEARALSQAAERQWWKALNDPILTEFIERGTAQNLDVGIALSRIRQSQAALRTAGGGLLIGDVTADATRSEAADQLSTTETYQATAGFILDIFGGKARTVQQSAAALQATEADLGTAQLALLGEIIDAYVQARYYQETATLQRQTIASRRETLAAVERRRGLEDATELDVQRARANLATAHADLPLLISSYETSVARLATLLAEPLEQMQGTVGAGRAIPRPAQRGRIGVPADLLRNRPDIIAAERRFASATAAVGVSTADLFPSVSLNGSITAGSSDSWSFGPRVTLPVLNRGVLYANRDAAIARAEQSELEWRKAVLKAMEEVETARNELSGWGQQLSSQRNARTALSEVLRLTRQSYDLGETPLPDLLDAERQLASAQRSVADAQRNATLAWVRLQIATGQGWNIRTAPTLVE